ncbi:MAG: hypothetical protein WCH02_01975 [Pseudomonadota bacterium]|jgi:uncharacterized integral membrane protein|tara:strand:+ start:29 stop:235 length:207 start_codon:yes stop_codon:yes gene_type:complete
MIGKFSAIIGAILFVVFLASITYSVLKSSIITASASIPVVVIVIVALGMMFYDFNRMLSLTSKNKKKR